MPCRAATMQAPQLHNSAVVAYRQGDLALAQQLFARALALNFAPSGKALFSVLIKHAAYSEAFTVAHQVLKLVPLDFAFAQYLLDELADYARLQQPSYQSLKNIAVGPISFVICSHRDARFASVQSVLARVMGSHPYELIRIADARSMNDGYARGLMQARYEQIVLCHDDIDILIPDFPQRLSVALEKFDLVGIAGTAQLSGDTLWHDGHPHLAGQVWQPSRTVAATAVFAHLATLNFGPELTPAQAVDGVFIATHRSLLNTVGFDQSQPGFHYYDLDLSYRNHRSGAKVGICQSLGVMHHSIGQIDDNWHRARAWFAAKYPELQRTASSTAKHWYECAVKLRDDALPLQQAINAFRALA